MPPKLTLENKSVWNGVPKSLTFIFKSYSVLKHDDLLDSTIALRQQFIIRESENTNKVNSIITSVVND